MSQGGGQNGTAGLIGGLVLGGPLRPIVRLFGGDKPRPPQTINFTPLEIANAHIDQADQEAAARATIDAAIAAGQEPSPDELDLLQRIVTFRELRERLLQAQMVKFPSVFLRFGVPLGATLDQLVAIVFPSRATSPGFVPFVPPVAGPGPVAAPGPVGARDPGFSPRLPARIGARGTTSRAAPSAEGFNAAKFISCLISSLLPTTGGRMPFVTTPGFAPSSGSFDFGGFGAILKTGLELARNIFAPSAELQPFPTPSQAGLVPIGPIVRGGRAIARQLPGFAGGVAAEGLFGLFGGADDADQTAAFTDPVPGRCRPKAHIKINPCTGKGVWFTPRGKPLVFSGDMSACRRVDRVAKRLDKARPKRRHHHHPR